MDYKDFSMKEIKNNSLQAKRHKVPSEYNSFQKNNIIRFKKIILLV